MISKLIMFGIKASLAGMGASLFILGNGLSIHEQSDKGVVFGSVLMLLGLAVLFWRDGCD